VDGSSPVVTGLLQEERHDLERHNLVGNLQAACIVSTALWRWKQRQVVKVRLCQQRCDVISAVVMPANLLVDQVCNELGRVEASLLVVTSIALAKLHPSLPSAWNQTTPPRHSTPKPRPTLSPRPTPKPCPTLSPRPTPKPCPTPRHLPPSHLQPSPGTTP